MACVTVNGDRLRVVFGPEFGAEDYGLFLETKRLPSQSLRFDRGTGCYAVETSARFACLLGEAAAGVDGEVEREAVEWHGLLFDYQRALVERALQEKRFCFWWDCGLGKTFALLEWARHVVLRTGGRVLVLSPLNVLRQTVGEAERWYGGRFPVEVIGSREGLADWCGAPGAGCGICNYEKLIPGTLPEMQWLAGVVLDESSILKTGGGTIKWNVIKSCPGVEYKLSCTATPAPNDAEEYASQCAFLFRDRLAMVARFWSHFHKPGKGPLKGEWKIREHARESFYRFMASWAIYLRNPAVYGWADNMKEVPPMEVREVRIDATPEQLASGVMATRRPGELLRSQGLGISERGRLAQVAKGFLYRKERDGGDFPGTEKVIRIRGNKTGWVAQRAVESAMVEGRQVIVWTVYNEEAADVEREIAGRLPEGWVAAVDGRMKAEDRPAVIDGFKEGRVRVLVCKAGMLGFGLNLQCCSHMIFSGLDDSYERFYQSCRRAYRYGQTHRVLVEIPYVPELEGEILGNVLAKKERFEHDTAEMERAFRDAIGQAAWGAGVNGDNGKAVL